MPQMMPLWWLIHLIFTTITINLYILVLHSTTFLSSKKKFFNLNKNNIKFLW
uniref:ATP synthase F0 subunit 8 n=1 Tax=Ceraphronidae sp. ZJUH_2016007 TaxID=2491153 RepID=A0A3S8V0G8_9HYME|nr:ATP synthase F0 subunit 8 [Ceraphronidae sp. ZJUH_2016007]